MIGNHDVARPASRYRLAEGFTPQTVAQLISLGEQNAEAGARRARAAALLLLALPGSAYIYQGEELGLPEVTASRTTRARIPGSAAPQARSPAATAAACPSPGPAPGEALDSRGVPGHRGLGCPQGAECPPGLALP